MDYYAMVQKSIDYIEDNLEDRIYLEQVAEQACFSITHFYRIFQAMVGESVKEYIRKRRLSEAAHKLLATKSKVIDIAFDYHFESQEAFTRAFDRMYGITPGRYRKFRQELLLFEKINVSERKHQNLFGGLYMEPKIIMKNGFSVIGMECQMSQEEKEAGFNPAVELWNKFNNRKGEIANAIPNVNIGLSPYETGYDAKHSYIAGVEVAKVDKVPDGMVVRTVPAAKFAVFMIKGKISEWGKQFDFIFGKWIPESKYEFDTVDSMEVYGEKAKDINSEEYEYELYLPIK